MTDDDRARGVIERREGATGLATGAKKTLVRGRGSRARESSERTTRRRPGDG